MQSIYVNISHIRLVMTHVFNKSQPAVSANRQQTFHSFQRATADSSFREGTRQ